MATQIPPPSKKQRRAAQAASDGPIDAPADLPQVRIRLAAAASGDALPQSLRVPGTANVAQLELLLNQLLGGEAVPYDFTLQGTGTEIKSDLWTDVLRPQVRSTEDELVLLYTPRAVFRVRTITRSSGVALGHGATILAAQFAPHTAGKAATGAGDATARLWSSDSGTPIRVLGGHGDHVLVVSWRPDGQAVATGARDASVAVWDQQGHQIGKTMHGHTKFVTGLAWEPLHLAKTTPRLVSSSKDGTLRIWDVERGVCEATLSGHTASVSCVRWGGQGYIYSASHDKTLKVWSSEGRLVSSHAAHGHWINHIAVSTEFALRSGPFGPTAQNTSAPSISAPPTELKTVAKEKYDLTFNGEERIVTASDDFTMFLWSPLRSTKPIARLTGHQKLVNHVAFSPDGSMLASASFDNSVKLWDGKTGKFVASLRGHVAAVYQCAWSADSRLLVSASKDTTLKVWDVKTRKLKSDLPGHQDEVYAVDWSVDGTKVVSGGRDKTVRFWSN